jgi:O-antigen/teichoic acid export membrane protein
MNIWTKLKTKLLRSKDLATLGSSDLIGGGITSGLWFYLASIMDAEAYGEIHFMISIAATGSILSLIVTPTVMTVYVSKNYKLESTLYFIILLIGLASSAVVILLFSRLDIGFLILGFIINDLAIAHIVGKKQYRRYAKYLLVQKLSAVILCISLFYTIGNVGIIYGLFISYLPFAIIIYKGFKETKINFSELKTRKGFIFNNYLTNIAGMFRGQIDVMLIGAFLGFSLLGNFAIALQIYTAFMIIPNIVIRYILPDDSRGISNTKLKKLLVIISILISIFGVLIAPHVISFVLPQYIDAIMFIQIMSLGVIPATLSLILQTKLLGIEKSKHVLIGRWISAITMISGIFLLGITYGTVGLALTFVLSSTLLAIYLTINIYLHTNESNTMTNGKKT